MDHLVQMTSDCSDILEQGVQDIRSLLHSLGLTSKFMYDLIDRWVAPRTPAAAAILFCDARYMEMESFIQRFLCLWASCANTRDSASKRVLHIDSGSSDSKAFMRAMWFMDVLLARLGVLHHWLLHAKDPQWHITGDDLRKLIAEHAAAADAAATEELNNMLLDACAHGWLPIAQLAISCGAQPSSTSGCLAVAIVKGHVRIVEMLLAHAAARKPHAVNPAATDSLMLAVLMSNTEIARALLLYDGPGAVRPDAWGSAVLKLAARRGNAEITQLLLAHSRRSPHGVRPGETQALLEAVGQGHGSVVRALLFDYDGLFPVRPDADMSRVLWLAVQRCDVGIVSLLLLHRMQGRPHSVRPSDGNSEVLALAAQLGAYKIAALLLKDAATGMPYGVRPRASFSLALRLAAHGGHLCIVRELLRYRGPGQPRPDALESEALCMAARNGHYRVVRELLAYSGPYRVTADAVGKALRLAISQRRTKTVQVLLSVKSPYTVQAMWCIWPAKL